MGIFLQSRKNLKHKNRALSDTQTHAIEPVHRAKKSTTWETRNVKLIQWKTLYIRWAKCINTYLLGGKQNAIMYSSQSPNIIIGRFICGRLQLGKY